MSGPAGEYTGRRHVILHGVDLSGRALRLEIVPDLLAKEILLQGAELGANQAVEGAIIRG